MLFTGELAAVFKGVCRNCCSRRKRGVRHRGEVTQRIPTARKGGLGLFLFLLHPLGILVQLYREASLDHLPPPSTPALLYPD